MTRHAERVILMINIAIPSEHTAAATEIARAPAGEAGVVPDAPHGDHLLHLVHRFGARCALGNAAERHLHHLGSILDWLELLLHLHCGFDILEHRGGERLGRLGLYCCW